MFIFNEKLKKGITFIYRNKNIIKIIEIIFLIILPIANVEYESKLYPLNIKSNESLLKPKTKKSAIIE